MPTLYCLFSCAGERSPDLCLTQPSVLHSNSISGGYSRWLFLNQQVWSAGVLNRWRRILQLQEAFLIVCSNLVNSSLILFVCQCCTPGRTYRLMYCPSTPELLNSQTAWGAGRILESFWLEKTLQIIGSSC